MIISVDSSTLRAARWRPYALRFGLGGAMTVITGLLATRWGPVFGGLFLAFPVILPASATLIARQERDRKARKGLHGGLRARRAAALDAFGATYGAAGMMVFAAFIWNALPRHRAGSVLVAGAVLWLLLSLVLWWLQKARWLPRALRRASHT